MWRHTMGLSNLVMQRKAWRSTLILNSDFIQINKQKYSENTDWCLHAPSASTGPTWMHKTTYFGDTFHFQNISRIRNCHLSSYGFLLSLAVFLAISVACLTISWSEHINYRLTWAGEHLLQAERNFTRLKRHKKSLKRDPATTTEPQNPRVKR